MKSTSGPADLRTLFEIYDPARLEKAVQEAEVQVQTSLESGFIRTGVEKIDYLVDQIQFMKAGWNDAVQRGLQGLAALEWVEYLSWPECSRQVRTIWRRRLLHRYAFETPVALWQGAGRTRRRKHPAVRVGPPRRLPGALDPGIYPPPTLSLGPYPSCYAPKRLAPASLEVDIALAPWKRPSLLTPVRRLDRFHTWTLQAHAARIYARRGRVAVILLDEPRDYSPPEIQKQLTETASQMESWLENVEGPSGMTAEQAEVHRGRIRAFRAAAAAIASVSSAGRAAILEAFFVLPGTIWMSAPEALPDDLPPEWLGVFLGFALQRKGLLSVREERCLRDAATTILETWQGTHYPRYELGRQQAATVVSRLAGMRRLLSRKSLFAYLAKAAQRVWWEEHGRGRNKVRPPR